MLSQFDYIKVNSCLWDSHGELEKELTESQHIWQALMQKYKTAVCPFSSGVEASLQKSPQQFLFPSIHILV